MANLQELQNAFIAADNSGNTEDAQIFANEIRKMQQPKTNEEYPSLGNRILTGMGNIAGGVVEPLAKMATGIIAKPVSEIAGLAASGYEASTGNKNSADMPSQFKNSVQNALTYEPKSDAGRSTYNPLNFVPKAIGNVVGAPANVTGYGLNKLGSPEWLTSGVKESINQGLGLGMAKLAPSISTKLDNSYQTKIDNLKALQSDNIGRDAIKKSGQDIGLISPAESGIKTSIEKSSGASGAISLKNQRTATGALAQDVGLGKGSISDSAIDTRKATLNKAYDNVEKALPEGVQITPDFENKIASGLSNVERNYKFAPKANEGLAPTVNLLKEQLVIAKSGGNISTDLVMSQIKELRSSASQLEKSTSASPAQITEATTRTQLANLYEDLIENSLKDNTNVLDNFRDARIQLAKIHVLDAARTPDGMVNLQKFASVAGRYADKSKPLTGKFKTVADFANTFGDVTKNITPSSVTTAHPWEIAGALSAVPMAVASGSAIPLITALPAIGRVAGPMLGSAGMLQTKVPSYLPSMLDNIGNYSMQGTNSMLGNISPALPYLTNSGMLKENK